VTPPIMTMLVIALPIFASLLILLTPKRWPASQPTILMAATIASLFLSFSLFGKESMVSFPWLGGGLDFSFRLYQFSAFIVAAVAAFSFLIALYTLSFFRADNQSKLFAFYLLLSQGLAAGAVLANNLVVMLFFWEALLLTLFGFILLGGQYSFKTAIKAFTINGITDLCMMLGIVLTIFLAGTATMTKINLPLDTLGATAFIFLMIGAIAKAGSMPFHTWIPDAALDAPLPFMAFLPAALEKLLGIYLLTRISFDLFQLKPESWVSSLLMIVGAATLILAVLMALIQKNYKKLLSYHAISQVGYMILGLGTAVPAGMVGGLFHMINHAMYKSCLFLTGGSVEKQAGTTDLEKLGGLGWKMPVTFGCFLIAAASISGVPPFNGFFSKELVYDGALERGTIFYVIALLGSFFTAASFLKLGHAAYFGQAATQTRETKEAAWPMLLPMIIIAALCLLFGLWNALPLNNLIQPVFGQQLAGHNYAGLPHNLFLIVMTVIVIGLALLNHWFGVKRYGSGLKAADHIHYAPGLKQAYNLAEKKFFDPYELGLKAIRLFAIIAWGLDRLIDWLYSGLATSAARLLSLVIRKSHSGNYATYLWWVIVSLAGSMLYIFMVK